MRKVKTTATEDDINLAKIYFTLLVEVAHRGETLDYGELMSRATERYHSPTYRGCDGALQALRDHTNFLGLADITSLCVFMGGDKGGHGYHLDSEAHRKFVYEMVWLDYYCEVQSLLDETRAKLEFGISDKW